MNRGVRLWAPAAHRVDVVIGSRPIAMQRGGDGWWRGPALDSGDDYAFSVDGKAPAPDPRSRWQPGGVHAPSRWLDPAALRSTTSFTPVPLARALVYELHVGTFSAAGTFAGAIPHLDHLVELGVTHVELMPVAQFSGAHGWGYDGVDLFAPHAPYGGPAGLHELVRACHERGLAVLLDVVHNHFGPDGAYLCGIAPYTHGRHETPWGEAVNLDGEHAREVRRFFIDSALAWVSDYGIDGLRLDAVHALFDDSERHFVAELADAVHGFAREQGRRIVLIGEYDDHDPSVVTDRAHGGWGLDAHWNDDFHHAVHALVTGERHGYFADFAEPGTFAKVLEQGYALDGGLSAYRGQTHGKPFGSLPRDRLVAYIQSHDQVGNRAAGERMHHLCGLARTQIAAAMLFVSPFVPMIFQGEEWAASTPFCYFADHESPELREAVRAGRRAEHAWTGVEIDPIDPTTVERSTLRWHERDGAGHAVMLRWYRALAKLRATEPSLRDPSPGSTYVRREGSVLVIDRGPIRLACNLSGDPARVELGDVVLASNDHASSSELPAWSCALVRV